jgi:hypothetical protein
VKEALKVNKGKRHKLHIKTCQEKKNGIESLQQNESASTQSMLQIRATSRDMWKRGSGAMCVFQCRFNGTECKTS